MDGIGNARLALADAAKRTAELIGLVDDMDLPVPGSEWSVGGTASHLIFVLRAFTDSADGDDKTWQQVEGTIATTTGAAERVAAINRLLIPAEPSRSPAAAGVAITEGVEAFLASTIALSPHHVVPTPWYGTNESLTVAEATCLLLGEQAIHGYDIAKAARRKWPITRTDACLILEAVHAMMPKMADPDALKSVSATYRLHLGGTSGFIVQCTNGAIHVEPPVSKRIDCHVAADPVAFVLLGYGRVSQWQVIARAKMITWGRKPWLAFRLTSFMTHP